MNMFYLVLLSSLEESYYCASIVFYILSFLIAVASICTAYKSYQDYLKNELKNNQLKVVADLVRQIQQEDFLYLTLNGFGTNIKKNHIATIFDIADIELFDESKQLYFWQVDSDEELNSLINWSFYFKFYSNPFLPKSIALKLREFNTWQITNVIFKKTLEIEKYIAIGRKRTFNENSSYYFYTRGKMATGKEFRQICNELRQSILDWAKEYGIDDINITNSHANS